VPRKKSLTDRFGLQKCPTGIQGLDEITLGGIPKGRPTLLTGAAGSGKTLIALEFLVKGATVYDEPGVFMAFEETSEELTTNVSLSVLTWIYFHRGWRDSRGNKRE
jgi:circadian clock protein KaiC